MPKHAQKIRNQGKYKQKVHVVKSEEAEAAKSLRLHDSNPILLHQGRNR